MSSRLSRPLSRPSARRAATLALAAALVLSACGKGSDEGDAGPVAVDGMAPCAPISAEPSAEAPEVPSIDEKATEVVQKDIKAGKGCAVGDLTFVNLNMVGATAGGTTFIDTWASGRPLSVNPTGGALLPALATAIEGMEVGGIRSAVIPSAEAYGADGNEAQGIGPDEDIAFVVEMISISKGPEYCQEVPSLEPGTREGKPESIDMPVEAPTELVIEDLEPGEGDEIVAGNYVTIDYVGVLCSTARQFDSSWEREDGFSFTAGMSGAIEGMLDGVIGAKKGGLRRIEIPFGQAYGEFGQGDIGPNETLVFVVRIADVQESDPALATPTIDDGTGTDDGAGTDDTAGTDGAAGDDDGTGTDGAAGDDGTATETTTTEAP